MKRTLTTKLNWLKRSLQKVDFPSKVGYEMVTKDIKKLEMFCQEH